MYSNTRNDVPRVAQRYGTFAAHTRRRASVLVVFVVFCVHMYSFAGLIRRTPPPTFSDTAITDPHSDTTIFQLRAHWVRISWFIGLEKRSDMCPWWESNPRLPTCKASTLSIRPGSPLIIASNGRVDQNICCRATIYQDVMTCFKLHIIIFNINCVLMRHGFILFILFQSQINISKESKCIYSFATNEYAIFNTSLVGLSVPWLF